MPGYANTRLRTLLIVKRDNMMAGHALASLLQDQCSAELLDFEGQDFVYILPRPYATHKELERTLRRRGFMRGVHYNIPQRKSWSKWYIQPEV